MQKTTFTLHKLESLLGLQTFVRPSIDKPTDSFYVVSTPNTQYIKPTFSSEETGIKKGILPKVIIISAAGATGKSELTKYLSATFGMPIFDLSLHAPVASNSLTGLFFDTLGAKGLANYVDNLEKGNATMIIDALDEGHLKTTVAAFDAFLDGIINIAQAATGTPFILLGRTNIVDHCALYLWENEVSAEVLHIAPFTIEQAKEFIDKRLDDTAYNQQYRIVRDHIINSVQGFFRNESQMAKTESQEFIGYAPVLLSIVVLLKRTNNYMALYEELKIKNDKGVELILDIMNLILRRDREQKLLPILYNNLFKDRDPSFVSQIEKHIYSEDEQCIRILYFLLGEKPQVSFTEDAVFNHQYEKLAEEWLKEHPFIQNGKIQNAVFESFVITKLMRMPEHGSIVLRYLRTRYKNAFMLFFLFDRLSDERNINPTYLQYLLNSLKSLDDKTNYYGMDLYSYDDKLDESQLVECKIDFYNTDNLNQKYEFNMTVSNGTNLILEGPLSNVDISIPLPIYLKSKRLEFGSPVSITCPYITIETTEFMFEKKRDGDIILECNEFTVDYSSGQVPQIIDYGNQITDLVIISQNKPDHPFSDFYHIENSALSDVDAIIMDKYLRLRKILMQFRSHSKGELAKLKDKIEHPRVLKNDLGWEVLSGLTRAGIIFADAHLYKVNPDALNTHLGLSYLDLKRKVLNIKTVKFLENM